MTYYIAERERMEREQKLAGYGKVFSCVGEVFAMATLASSCRGGRNTTRGKEDILKIHPLVH